MFKRVVTSIIGLPFIIFFVVVGGLLLQAVCLILSLIGLREFYHVLSKKTLPIHYVGYLFSVIYVLALPYLTSTICLAMFLLFIITMFTMLVILHEKVNITDCAITFIGFFYVVFLFSFVILVRNYTYGQFAVWLIFISAWGSDTFAYFTGKMIGKHKLSPKLSPKKTIEGSIGGIVGATILAIVYAIIISNFYEIEIENVNLVLCFGISTAFASAFSQVGDLAASSIKRSSGAKDYGNIIPGHGGVLDRFDSILFTAPSVFIVMHLLVIFS